MSDPGTKIITMTVVYAVGAAPAADYRRRHD